MKRLISSAFLTLLLVNANAQESALKKDSVLVLADTFCMSNLAPVPYLRGTVVKLNCDTAYIINKMRLAKYEAARKFILNSNNRTNRELMERYEAALDEQDKYYKELLKSYGQSDSISQNLIKGTRNDLLGVSTNLKNACSSIDTVNSKLDDVQALIKKQKWESLKQKILVGFGGLGAGILIGIVVAH
jgi:hypothetical protein